MRLLITRPAGDAQAAAGELEALGHAVLTCPLITVVKTDEAKPNLSAIQAFIVTDADGARALSEAVGVRTFPVFCESQGTATTLTGLGFTDVRSADGDASALAKLIERSLTPKLGGLVYVCSTSAAVNLQAMLGNMGFAVRMSALYEVKRADALPPQITAALKNNALDGAVFFSADEARAFAQLVQRAELEATTQRLVAVVAAPVVAAPLTILKFAKVATAPKSDPRSVIGSVSDVQLAREREAAEAAAAAQRAKERQDAERQEAEQREKDRQEAERLAKEREAAEKAAAAQREKARIAAEQKAAEQREKDRQEAERLAKEREAAEKVAAAQREKDRIAAEQKAVEQHEKDRQEAERRAKEREAAEKVAAAQREKERIAAEQKAVEQHEKDRQEAERRAKEREAAEKAAAAQREKDRIAAEQKAAEQREKDRQEAERKAQERAVAEKVAAEQRERDRELAEKAAAERRVRQQQDAEQLAQQRHAAAKLAEERHAQARADAERLDQERRAAEKQAAEQHDKAWQDARRLAAEKRAKELEEVERLESERRAAAQLIADQRARERRAAEQQAAEQQAAAQREKYQAEAERLAQERQAAKQRAAEKAERELREAERLKAERLEAKRLETERLETERLEAERRKAEQEAAKQRAAEQREVEKREAERREIERLEAKRIEAERIEAERIAAERLAAEQKAAEQRATEQRAAEARAAALQRIAAEASSPADAAPGQDAVSGTTAPAVTFVTHDIAQAEPLIGTTDAAMIDAQKPDAPPEAERGSIFKKFAAFMSRYRGASDAPSPAAPPSETPVANALAPEPEQEIEPPVPDILVPAEPETEFETAPPVERATAPEPEPEPVHDHRIQKTPEFVAEKSPTEEPPVATIPPTPTSEPVPESTIAAVDTMDVSAEETKSTADLPRSRTGGRSARLLAEDAADARALHQRFKFGSETADSDKATSETSAAEAPMTPPRSSPQRRGSRGVPLVAGLAVIAGVGYVTSSWWMPRLQGTPAQTPPAASVASPAPSQSVSDPQTAGNPMASLQARADALAADVVALNARMAAVEQRPAGGPGDPAALAALSKRVAVLESAPAVDGTAPEGLSASVTNQARQLASVTARVATLEAALGNAAKLEDLATRLAALEGKSAEANSVLALGDRLAALEKRDAVAATALVLATAQLRDAVQSGRGYAVELETVGQLSARADVPFDASAMKADAANGLTQASVLKTAFPAAATVIVRADALPDATTGWVRRMLDRVYAILSVRPFGTLEGDSVGAIVARAEQALKHDNLAQAVTELEALKGAAATAATPWLAPAKAYVNALKAVDELSVRSVGAMSALNRTAPPAESKAEPKAP